jgi:hypothetical protein
LLGCCDARAANRAVGKKLGVSDLCESAHPWKMRMF